MRKLSTLEKALLIVLCPIGLSFILGKLHRQIFHKKRLHVSTIGGCIFDGAILSLIIGFFLALTLDETYVSHIESTMACVILLGFFTLSNCILWEKSRAADIKQRKEHGSQNKTTYQNKVPATTSTHENDIQTHLENLEANAIAESSYYWHTHENILKSLNFDGISATGEDIPLSQIEKTFLKYINGLDTVNLTLPIYWTLEFNIQYQCVISKFIEGGYLIISPEKPLETFTVVELKEILAKNKLKVSGRKDELVNRIKNGLETNDVDRSTLTDSKYFNLTSSGKNIVENALKLDAWRADRNQLSSPLKINREKVNIADVYQFTEQDHIFLEEAKKQIAQTLEDENLNPKFSRTEQEEELSFNFSQKHSEKIFTLENNLEQSTQAVFNKVSKDFLQNATLPELEEGLEQCKHAIHNFNELKSFCVKHGKGGTIYFQDTWEHLHNSKKPCFSYVENLIDFYESIEDCINSMT